MSSTNYTPGTVITSSWLNDVNKVTYNAAANITGAVARSAVQRNAERVSVADFGAVGDYNGTTGTDNTAAIQAAINYVQNTNDPGTYGSYSPGAGAAILFFPAGSYRVTDVLNVTKKIHILGEGPAEYSTGSRLFQTTANKHLFSVAPIASGMSFSVENMTLSSTLALAGGTGNLVNITRTTALCNSQRYIKTVFANAQNYCGLFIGDDIHIDGCVIDVSQGGFCFGTTTAAEVASSVRILGCDFFQVSNSYITAVNLDEFIMTGCTAYTVSGLKTAAILDGRTTTPYQLKNISIVGNQFQNARSIAYANNINGLVVASNNLRQMGTGAGETRNLIDLVGVCSNISVTGNSISASMDTKHVYDDTGATTITNCIITGNTFDNAGGTGTAIVTTTAPNTKVYPNVYNGYLRNVTANDYIFAGAPLNNLVLQTYSASITLDISFGNTYIIGPSNSTAFTINAPINPSMGQVFSIQIRNASGGALGTATWNAAFKMNAWVQPANGFSRTITFLYNGSAYVEINRTTSDVAN